MRNLPGPRSYSYLVGAVPGVLTNGNNVTTGPVFLIFPIHGGRGVESRLTVDGLNISNPPGGNQPPNFTADIANSQEVSMITSGGLGEMETAGLTMNIVPRQGGNRFTGLGFVSGFSEGMQADNFTAELQGARRHPADSGHPGLRRQRRRRRADCPGQALVLLQHPRPGIAAEHAERLLQQERRQRERLGLRSGSEPSRRYSDRTWENYTPRITWQVSQRNKITGSWDEQPVCRSCTGTTSLTGTPNFFFPTSPEADGHGEFSPQRVQTCAGRRR